MNPLVTPNLRDSETVPAPRTTRSPDAILIAAMAILISGIAAGHPCLWFDEAATISAAANRSLPELWRLLGHIDAVHGLYYLGMHGWFAVFPATEFWSRVPSFLAVGTGAAGVVVLGKQLATRRVAVSAGVLFAILPRVTWAGIEARPYALSAMASVWLTVLCTTASRRAGAPIWAKYGLAVLIATLLNIFTVLMLPVHAVLIRALGCDRAVVRRWAAASGVALAALIPFLLFSKTQVYQVGWIHPLNPHTAIEVVQQQYFDKSAVFAVLAGIVIAAGAATARWRQVAAPGQTPQLLALCAAWILLPTIAVLAYSALAKPLYYPRYLIGTAPAMAIVLAVCVNLIAGAHRGLRPTAVLIAVFVIAAAPNYLLTQRGRNAKEGWDYSQVADVVKAQALPGDCLLIDNTTRWAPGPIRALLAARPDAFVGLADPGRGPLGPIRGRLWDGHLGVWAVVGELARCSTIWTITDHDRALPAYQAGTALPVGKRFSKTPDGQLLRWFGFRVVERWQFSYAQVNRSTR